MHSSGLREKSDKVDYIFKILSIGESGVGKTCILLRYTDNKFSKNHLTTIGIDFKIKTIGHLNKKIKLYIWDTAGQERFKNVAHQYYNGSDGIFLVFDLTDRTSFDKVTEWIKQILNYNLEEKIAIILLGNKVDSEKRVVNQEEANDLANELGIKYLETSALSNYNLDKAFNCMVEEILIKKKIEINYTRNTEMGRITITREDHYRKSKISEDCKC
jgi:small GTP-binding protein